MEVVAAMVATPAVVEAALVASVDLGSRAAELATPTVAVQATVGELAAAQAEADA